MKRLLRFVRHLASLYIFIYSAVPDCLIIEGEVIESTEHRERLEAPPEIIAFAVSELFTLRG